MKSAAKIATDTHTGCQNVINRKTTALAQAQSHPVLGYKLQQLSHTVLVELSRLTTLIAETSYCNSKNNKRNNNSYQPPVSFLTFFSFSLCRMRMDTLFVGFPIICWANLFYKVTQHPLFMTKVTLSVFPRWLFLFDKLLAVIIRYFMILRLDKLSCHPVEIGTTYTSIPQFLKYLLFPHISILPQVIKSVEGS